MPESVAYCTFKACVVLHRNQVRMILPEPRQKTGLHLVIEVVHDERAEDGDLVMMGEAVELILEAHAGRHVSLLPEHVDHLSPPAHFRIPTFPPRFGDNVRRQTEEYRRIGHGVFHEAGQGFVRIDNGELSYGRTVGTSQK